VDESVEKLTMYQKYCSTPMPGGERASSPGHTCEEFTWNFMGIEEFTWKFMCKLTHSMLEINAVVGKRLKSYPLKFLNIKAPINKVSCVFPNQSPIPNQSY
jgi:hypothetical protein